MMKSNSKSNMHRLAVLLVVPALACFLWAFAEPEYHYITGDAGDNSAEMLVTLPDSILYFLDDEEVTKTEVDKADPETFFSVNVYKEGFGLPIKDSEKRGVILIYTKEYKEKQKKAEGGEADILPLDKKITFAATQVKDRATGKIKVSSAEYPLVFIDGKEVTAEYYLNEFDQSTERGSNIIVPKVAQRVYGDKAKYGILIITTEKNMGRDKDLPPTIGKIEAVTATNNIQGGSISKDVLFIIDGKVMEKGKFQELSSDDIEKIEIFKDEAAVKLYGEKARNGVVVITKKK